MKKSKKVKYDTKVGTFEEMARHTCLHFRSLELSKLWTRLKKDPFSQPSPALAAPRGWPVFLPAHARIQSEQKDNVFNIIFNPDQHRS